MNHSPKHEVHEAYFKESTYRDIRINYERQRSKQRTQEELLIIAKAYFVQLDYPSCSSVLGKINPQHSSKVLFESQSLAFRAIYLDNRQRQVTQFMLGQMRQKIETFYRNQARVPGPPMTAVHQNRFVQFTRFVELLEKYGKGQIKLDPRILKQEREAEFRRQTFEGFPCYLISSLWCDDFHSALRVKTKVGPINNFSIINDIFQAHEYPPEQGYRNVIMFPGERVEAVTKGHWNFMNAFFNEGAQFGPIKRLFKTERSTSSYYGNQWGNTYNGGSYSNGFNSYHTGAGAGTYNGSFGRNISSTSFGGHSSNFSDKKHYQLLPVPLKYGDKLTIFQVDSLPLLENSFLPFIESLYGLGQLCRQTKDGGCEFIEAVSRPQQQIFNSQIFVYVKIQVPPGIQRKHFIPLCRFKIYPLPQTVFNQEKGLKGLENLGNTCYMNSTIQCISFTKQLTHYLTTRDLIHGIDFQKTDGVVLMAFADLLKQKWADNDLRYVEPSRFKKSFGKKNPIFSGMQQQDAHEYILSLMNDLHQHIQNKGQTNGLKRSELKNTTSQSKVMAHFQRNQLAQNESIITDLFRGILHNSITCGQCKTVSHSYDVFLTLSVPIPHKSVPNVEIYYVKWKGVATNKIKVYLQGLKSGTDVFDLFKKKVIKDRVDRFDYYLIPLNEKQLTCKTNFNLSKWSDDTLMSLEQMQKIASEKQLIFVLYEVEPRKTETQELTMIEYKRDADGPSIGFPRLTFIEDIELLNDKQQLKTLLTEIDNQNRFHPYDIKSLKAYTCNHPTDKDKRNMYTRSLKVTFKYDQRLYSGSNFVDKEINDSTNHYTLANCFDLMRQPQLLENIWTCGQCKSRKMGEKMEQIQMADKYLIIHLKRFTPDYQKIRGMVTYPLDNLDMTPWLETTKGSNLYELYAICLHSGTAEVGHYRAYCKHFLTGKWYEFDDATVREIEEDKLVSQYAYMLFYRRKGP